MTGKLSKNFHGVGIGPLSNILAVKNKQKSDTLTPTSAYVIYEWSLGEKLNPCLTGLRR